MTVNLIPDITVFFQLVVFLVVIIFLTIFIFKPTLRILNKRHEQTAEMHRRAEMLDDDTNEINREYDKTLEDARLEGSKEQQNLIKEGQQEAEKIITGVKQEEKKASFERREYITKETESIKNSLDQKVDEYAKMIVSKILGSSSHENT